MNEDNSMEQSIVYHYRSPSTVDQKSQYVDIAGILFKSLKYFHLFSDS